MRCAVWIGFIWRFEHHYDAELLPRTQSLKEDPKIPVAQTIANEQKTRSRKRLLYNVGEKIWFRCYVCEERQVIVFSQDKRLRNIEGAVQMEDERIGRCWFVVGVFFKN